MFRREREAHAVFTNKHYGYCPGPFSIHNGAPSDCQMHSFKSLTLWLKVNNKKVCQIESTDLELYFLSKSRGGQSNPGLRYYFVGNAQTIEW